MGNAAEVQENSAKEMIAENTGMREFLDRHKSASSNEAQGSQPESKSESSDPGKPGATEAGEPKQKGEEGKKEDYLADDPFVNKLRDENRKYRARNKQFKEDLASTQQELRKLRDQVEGKSHNAPELTEEQKAFQANYEAKMKVSKTSAIKRWGEDKVEETFLDEEAPWRKIEERATEGDVEAFIMNQRVRLSDDPYSTAMEILEEEALYAEHGTRNLTELVKKVKEKAVKDQAEEVSSKLRDTQRRGAPVETLSSVRGGAENAKTAPQGQVPLADMALFKHLK